MLVNRYDFAGANKLGVDGAKTTHAANFLELEVVEIEKSLGAHQGVANFKIFFGVDAPVVVYTRVEVLSYSIPRDPRVVIFVI